ncbi:hypothetical protein LTR41_011240 [Exophiala xenobiotica]|nr:hypothetical protein LTR41_011240 [Exophiala xenobiotica]KAK5550931.1 hypothetical protein LTR46_011074 [Exophiala xenobiotica]
MANMTIKPQSPENLAWECGCSREDDSAFECDGTCRLNEGWTLRCAKDSFSVPGKTVAVLSGGNTAGLSSYTFKWSDNHVMLVIFRSHHSTVTNPFTTGTDLMTLDWMHDELLQSPNTFTHPSLERAALTEAVARFRVEESPRARDAPLSHPLQNHRTAIIAHSDTADNTSVEDDYIDIDDGDFYVQDTLLWQDWKPHNIIATLSGPAESGPILQRKDPAEQSLLYKFKLTRDHTLTISTRHKAVEAAWHELAERYKLQRGNGKDFKLADVYCFLQTDLKLPIPSEEVAALMECVGTVAAQAVKRLEHPTFTLLRDRSPVLQCESSIFTLCLRKEIKEQSEMLIQLCSKTDCMPGLAAKCSRS